MAEPSLRIERGHVDGEAVLHIGPDHSIEGFIDLPDGDDLDASGDVVLAAAVGHLLGFGDAADGGCQIAAS